MNESAESLGTQLRRNLVALISLVLAVASLGYTTWRNETSEAHRNVRYAAFRTLEELGELQVIVDARQYQDDRMRGDYVSGWARVLLIDDLCSLIPSSAAGAAAELHAVWQQNFDGWYSHGDAEAERRISTAITAARERIRGVLAELK